MPMQKTFLIGRMNRLRREMMENGILNAVLTDKISLRYLLGFKIESDFHLIITCSNVDNIKFTGKKEFGTLIVPRLEFERAKIKAEGLPIDVVASKNRYKVNDIAAVLREKYRILKGKIGLLFENLSLNSYTEIFDAFLSNTKQNEKEKNNGINKEIEDIFSILDSNNIINLDAIFTKLRQFKDKDEIEAIKKAAEIGDKAIEIGIASLKEGITESEIAAIIEFEMKKLGAEDKSFDTIVASGDNSWFPHAGATERIIHDGELVTIDMGATVNGYHSDLTRTVLVGQGPYDEKLVEIINTVNEAQQKALDVIKPGIKCGDVDKAARDFFNSKSVGDYFIHGLGHGVGLEVHDHIPRLAPGVEYILEPGMIVTVEPGIYIPDLGGARTEDLIHITEDGYESLSHAKVRWY